MNTRKLSVAAVSLSVALVGGVYASSAGATPPSIPGPAPSGLVQGPLDDTDRDDLEIEQDDVELEVDDPTTVQMFTLTYPPRSHSGWHSHAGIVLVVVESGTVVRRTADCAKERFTAGEAFYEVGAHRVSNPSKDVPAVLSITRVFPTALGAARIDEPKPACAAR